MAPTEGSEKIAPRQLGEKTDAFVLLKQIIKRKELEKKNKGIRDSSYE